MAVSREWADAFRQALGSRSQRKVAAEAEISQTYVGNCLLGTVPSEQIVVRLARVLGVNEEEFLIAAGHRAWNADAAFSAGMRAIWDEFPDEAPQLSLETWLPANATPEQVAEIIETSRARCEERRRKKRGRGGLTLCLA